jgi:opacity protein-like surface antigen
MPSPIRLHERPLPLKKSASASAYRRIHSPSFLAALTTLFIASAAVAQSSPESPYFARKNTFSFFGAYSNDSSHMLLGVAENRKLLDFGAGYSRRLFVDRIVNWQYSFEILPVALDSDPVQRDTSTVTDVFNNGMPTFTFTNVSSSPTGLACTSSTTTQTFSLYQIPTQTLVGTETVVSVFSCTRRWVIGEAISPIGFQWNFMPRKKLQPIVVGHGGYMYSTQPIPIDNAGSFNFTFDLGAGFELFQTKGRSIRAEYRYHHISNHSTAEENPGIDNGVFQLTYSFGR